MVRIIEVKCPYCGFTNNEKINVETFTKEIINCDVDEGGCDRDYVLKVKIKVDVEYLKIEGEEKTNET